MLTNNLGKGGYVYGSVGLFVCLFVSNIAKKLWTYYDGILWKGPRWYSEELISFGGNLGFLRWVNEQKKLNNSYSMSWSRCK